MNTSTILIEGLRKSQPDANDDPSKTYTTRCELKSTAPLSSLWVRLEASGYEQPDAIEKAGKRFTRIESKSVLNTCEKVTVVPNDQPSTKTQIQIDDKFIAHANEHYGQASSFTIGDNPENPKRPMQSLKNDRGLEITLQRTLRMPDDNKLHQLPGSLGYFDLYNVEAHAKRLPQHIKGAGGVFISVWQREAMWINFAVRDTWRSSKWAVKVYLGRINAVSGLRMDQVSELDGMDSKQDYVVIPGQEWLDGICVAPGVVRQFVAMPLGAGYTVEGQRTSEEKYGGLQIEIIPEFEKMLRWWVRDSEEHVNYSLTGSALLDRSKGIYEYSTPAEQGLAVGDILRSYAQPVLREETLGVDDILDHEEEGTWTAHYRSRVSIGHRRVQQMNSEVTTPQYLLSEVASYAPRRRSFCSTIDHSSFAAYDPRGTQLQRMVSERPTARHSQHAAGSVSNRHHYRDDDGQDEGNMSERETDPEREASQDQIDRAPELEIADLKAMGLAAGGKLVQDIYTDPYPAKIWNHAAARIINIHMLDPISCEKVTHMVPVPPPMDIYAYTETGGQFYVVEEKVDERLEGGEFDNVKSVSQMDEHVGVTTEPDFDPLKPKMCTECEIRLCDCIIRPCDHQFCNVCIKTLEEEGEQDPVLARKNWKCPTCNAGVSHVAGFSAPMNLPGEEPMRLKVPVNVLEINDGRVRFSSIQKTRV